MQNKVNIDPIEESLFFHFYQAECVRKEKLLDEFEKLEIKECRRKNPDKALQQKKYERLFRGCVFVRKLSGEHVHLVDQKGNDFGILHTNQVVAGLLRVNDALEGTFGFRIDLQLSEESLSNSTEDFMPTK